MKIKKKDIFFETLENMADTVVQAADYFSEHVSNLQDVTLFTNEMKNMSPSAMTMCIRSLWSSTKHSLRRSSVMTSWN